jgi:hypothetical protein
MDVLSLLFCKLPTDRQSVPRIWRYVAISAIALVMVGAGPELVSLWLGFAVGLCLRGRAQAGAKAIHDAWRLACGYTHQVISRIWHAQLFSQAAEVKIKLISSRRDCVALSALSTYQPHFGIPLTVSPPSR